MNRFILNYLGIFFILLSILSIFNIIYSYYFNLYLNIDTYFYTFLVSFLIGLGLINSINGLTPIFKLSITSSIKVFTKGFKV